MAEDGTFQPLARGNSSYKAGSSGPASRPSVLGNVGCLITARSAPAKEIGTGLCVFAQPHDEYSSGGEELIRHFGHRFYYITACVPPEACRIHPLMLSDLRRCMSDPGKFQHPGRLIYPR